MPIRNVTEDIPRADLVTAIRNIYFLAQYHGIEKLANALSKEDIEPVREAVIDEIMNKVCASYKLSRHELIHSLKKGAPAEARMMCFVLMKKYLKLSEEKIGKYFNKTQPFIHKMWTLFESMNPKIKAHKDFLIRFEDIDGEMFEFFKTITAKRKLKTHGRKQSR